jgi:two-component sensor histidine kinase
MISLNATIRVAILVLLAHCSLSQNTLVLNEAPEQAVDVLSSLNVISAAGESRPAADTLPSLPYNHEHHFSFRVRNATSTPLSLVVKFGEWYVTARNIEVNSSSRKDFFTTPRNSFETDLSPGEEQEIKFCMSELNRVDPRKISIRLMTLQRFAEDVRMRDNSQSFFLGLMAFLVVFNLVIYFFTGWKVYVKYVVYILSALLYFLYHYSYMQKVFPSVNYVPINIVSSLYHLIFILYFYFINDFGQYKKYSPWAWRLLNIGIINKIIQTVYEVILNPFGVEFIYSPWYRHFILIWEMALMACIIYFIARTANIRSRIVFSATLLLIAGAIIGQLEVFVDTRGYWVELGITAELLLFSVGLGYITKLNEEEKNAAQRAYISQLEENKKIQHQINEELDLRVRKRTEQLENAQGNLEVKNRENESLLTEIHHRVKNNLQIISGLINLKLGRASEETRSVLTQLNARIFSMGLIHEKLYQGKNIQLVRLDTYLAELSDHLNHSFTEGNVEFEFKTCPLEMEADRILACGLVYNELVTNALKHAFSPGQNKKICLEVKVVNNQVEVVLTDNGENLNPAPVKSFGLHFVEQLVKTKLKGTWELTFNHGSHTRIQFPHH